MPTISTISPVQGHGGTAMTITGSGLGNSPTTTKVNFGAITVTPTSVNSTSVACTVPGLCGGQVNVAVSVSGVLSNSKPFFSISTPSCSFVTPSVGPASGGTAVTVTGTSLATASTVTFDAETPVAATNPVGDNQVSAVSPAHTVAGDTDTVNVVVTTSGGTSVPSGAPSQFTYYNTPTVTGVSPDTGPAGEPGVVIGGTRFVDVSAVTFRDVAAPNATFAVDFATISGIDSTQMTLTAPAGLVATHVYDVLVTTPAGQSAINAPADQYTATA